MIYGTTEVTADHIPIDLQDAQDLVDKLLKAIEVVPAKYRHELCIEIENPEWSGKPTSTLYVSYERYSTREEVEKNYEEGLKSLKREYELSLRACKYK